MLKRGGLRLLTTGEIKLAKKVFEDQIQYNKVWIHHGSYLPFSMQEKNTAMTPNGEIWFETNVYRDDYSLSSVDYKHLFMHEMMHVWQYQRGMNVKLRGMVSWATNYEYDFDKHFLSSYSMEQQASIIADFWLIAKYSLNPASHKRIIKYKKYDEHEPVRDLVKKYENIFGGFPR